MQRILNVNKWLLVPEGRAINFGSELPRRVRLDVNAPDVVQLDYSDGDGNVTFLANVLGRDVIEFTSHGAFAVTVTGGDCWVYTVDGEDFSFSIPDAVVLTKLVERRTRNPELERMQFMMNQNIERRMEQQRHELEQLWSRRQTAERVAAEVAADQMPRAADKVKPEPAGPAGGDAEPKPPANGSAAATAD